MEQTLSSVLAQTNQDWEVQVVYDKSEDDGSNKLYKWELNHNTGHSQTSQWHTQHNTDQRFAVRNQYEGIKALHPANEDIIVFLDLDGDRLAHPHVLERLAEAYRDDTLLTYGSYRPIPHVDTCQPARPFPPEVIASNSYRQYLRDGGECCFNHLRTMKGKLFNAMPPERFKWDDGRWYTAGTDYLFMTMGLELAGPRHKFIEETLLLYNHANPLADYLYHPLEASQCTVDSLKRPPLAQL